MIVKSGKVARVVSCEERKENGILRFRYRKVESDIIIKMINKV